VYRVAFALQGDVRPRFSPRSLHVAGGLMHVTVDRRVTIDHDFGRVHAMVREHGRILSLPRAERRLGERISPPQVVPIVDVLLERDHRHAIDRLRAIELGQVGVRRRATAAPFGGEELDDDGGGAERSGGRGAGRMGRVQLRGRKSQDDDADDGRDQRTHVSSTGRRPRGYA